MFRAIYHNENKTLEIFLIEEFKEDNCVVRFEQCEFSEVPTLIEIFKRNNQMESTMTLTATGL